MSWAAHELESYVLKKHIYVRISYLAILAGCLAPDLITKTWTYGFTIGGTHYGGATPRSSTAVGRASASRIR